MQNAITNRNNRFQATEFICLKIDTIFSINLAFQIEKNSEIWGQEISTRVVVALEVHGQLLDVIRT